MFKYGDEVSFKEKYIRKTNRSKSSSDTSTLFHPYSKYKEKEWIKREFLGSGLFLGERTLANGIAEFDSEYGWVFSAKEYIKVAIISPGPRKNVFYSPIDSLELIACHQ